MSKFKNETEERLRKLEDKFKVPYLSLDGSRLERWVESKAVDAMLKDPYFKAGIKELIQLQQDFQLLLDHLGLEIAPVGKREIRKVARKNVSTLTATELRNKSIKKGKK